MGTYISISVVDGKISQNSYSDQFVNLEQASHTIEYPCYARDGGSTLPLVLI